MTSCDTNVLFAALEATRPGHRKARAFLESHRDNREFALCELVLVELYLLARNPVICRKALGAPEAVAMIRQLSANPAWRLVDYPGPEHALSERLWRLAASRTSPGGASSTRGSRSPCGITASPNSPHPTSGISRASAFSAFGIRWATARDAPCPGV